MLLQSIAINNKKAILHIVHKLQYLLRNGRCLLHLKVEHRLATRHALLLYNDGHCTHTLTPFHELFPYRGSRYRFTAAVLAWHELLLTASGQLDLPLSTCRPLRLSFTKHHRNGPKVRQAHAPHPSREVGGVENSLPSAFMYRFGVSTSRTMTTCAM